MEALRLPSKNVNLARPTLLPGFGHMTGSDHDRDTPLWRFSLAVYAAPGVEAECLALQAAHDIDVNLLLFCAWAGAERGWRLSPADLERLDGTVSAWREAVIKPLRSARRAIKAMPAPQSPAVRELRSRIAADELEAERIEQALLFAEAIDAAAPPRAGAGPPARIVRENVALLLAPHGAALPEALIAAALSAAPVRS